MIYTFKEIILVTVWKMGYGEGERERQKWGGQLGGAVIARGIKDGGLVQGFIRDTEKQTPSRVWI